MIDTLPPSALRVTRAHLGGPVVLAVLTGTTVILAFSDPFRTLELLSPMSSAAYWAMIVFGTYAIGTATVACLYLWTGFPRLPALLRAGLGGVVLGLVAAAALLVVDAVLFADGPVTTAQVLGQIGGTTVISLVVMAVREVVLAGDVRQDPAASDRVPGAVRHSPTIIDRLPQAGRGRLLALSAEDHYVYVITTAGEVLVLIRLTDAMRETGEVAGLQVHRSHWVARSAMQQVRRNGEAAVMILSSRRRVPVSRRFLPAVRNLGLLSGRTAEGGALAGMDHL